MALYEDLNWAGVTVGLTVKLTKLKPSLSENGWEVWAYAGAVNSKITKMIKRAFLIIRVHPFNSSIKFIYFILFQKTLTDKNPFLSVKKIDFFL